MGTPPDQTGGVYRFWSWTAGQPMRSDRPAKHAHRDEAGVPPAAICEARAVESLRAAEKTNLSNVRNLYTRSALRWAELAELKALSRDE